MNLRRSAALAALALVPLALYARVATFEFVQADDTDLIRGNIGFLQNLGNVPAAFARSYFDVEGQAAGRKTYYRPLVIVSFMLDGQVRGADPRVYHVTNVLLHVLTVMLLFVLLRRLKVPDTPALVLALLFAIHPANVQAVAWIPGRNDTLMAALALVSLVAFLHYYVAVGVASARPSTSLGATLSLSKGRRADSGTDPGSQRQETTNRDWLALHVATFAAALFTKESALALPIVVVLLAWAVPVVKPRSTRSLRSALVADAIVVAVWFVMRRRALMGDDQMSASAVLASLAGNARDLLLYAGKMVLPVNLNVMPGLTRVDVVLGVVSLLLLGWFLYRLTARWRWLVAGWLLAFLIPALTIPGLPAYEHRLYFPLIGVIVGMSQLSISTTRSRRSLAMAAAVCVVFAGLSFAHSGVFRNRYTYWQNGTRGTPFAGLAHVNLGQIAESDGDPTGAAGHYRAALAADPMTPGAHNNLGVLAARRGAEAEARAEFQQEVERHPANADAYFNLGLVEKFSNRFDEAASWWERAVAVDPRHLAAHEELAGYYRAKGDFERAERHRAALGPR
ncbi:MAG TPA: tetratricopeptide repeat protein [Vicinamibacterales bacterium]|nr:tetratricopeptide repeat protein [Vicinamibacterales bacterium]